MGECLWNDKCPLCEGKGKLFTKSTNQMNRISSELDRAATPCEACNGTGIVLISKKLRKRDK